MRSTNHVGKTTFYDMDIDVSRYDDIFLLFNYCFFIELSIFLSCLS